ncbi:MAG: PEP/pyruvate-binding domain-containing protein [Thermoanaerobaculia bacterium]
MMPPGGPVDTILYALQERAKELTCLYRVNEICSRPQASVDEIFRGIVDVLPPGWQWPTQCQARITADDVVYAPPGWIRTPWLQSSPIRVQGEVVGSVEVSYRKEMPLSDEGPFLKEERKLIDTVAERLSELLLHRKLLDKIQTWHAAVEGFDSRPREDWWVIIDFLRKTDQHLLVRISRRMINFLCWNGVAEAQELLPRFTGSRPGEALLDENRPLERRGLEPILRTADEAFQIAAGHLPSDEILSCIQKWIKDDKSGFLVEAVENQGTSVTEIAQALGRFHNFSLHDQELSRTIQVELRVSLCRRFLTDNLEFINIAKEYIDVGDFYDLARHIICPLRSHGRLGGKGAGLFLATHIVRRSTEFAAALGEIRTPKTWYVSSDGILDFIEYNQLEDLHNRKYLEIDQIRREYPHVIQVFKNSHFSPEIIKGLSLALDDFGEKPIIVRSSSLLEDRVGAAFSGKYKSLFLANQGTKNERLAALLDAIAEVYASVFGPDPIEYRAERGLLDFHEEMGVLIQEVVGSRVGKYFLPTFAGVAFSNNEFRWSARIRREDGLVRMVPGLGTRAVDRIGDDYPVLLAPGQPGLRVNVTPDEIVRYSPKRLDVINMESRSFETIDLATLLEECGGEVPGFQQVLSVAEDGGIRRADVVDWSSGRGRFVTTFDGLVGGTPFLPRMRALLRLLGERTGGPVDIEFASDGKDLYLLQCRRQSFADDASPAQIPRDLSRDRIVFEARRYVSNGRVPDITQIVYVDPEAYNALPDLDTLKRVGRAVGRLNKLLPKQQFILMGPGRWGSRGDVKLGVPVGYSDINNTAALIEVARKHGNYVPDVSFGTHFFQDLVEASIRYLPLYPDDPDIVFNETFLKESPSILPEIAAEFADLAETVRVIDVPKATGGLVLRILMNADQDHAVGYLTSPSAADSPAARWRSAESSTYEDHSWWRQRMAERIAAEADPVRFGIQGIWLTGSVKNATAGPGSDIDLIIHLADSTGPSEELQSWLKGWSQCLSEMSFLRTGVRTEGILDVHFLTDDDIRRQTSFAVKIGAVTDAARPLPMRPTPECPDHEGRVGPGGAE